jgi:pimeloyl-ACP methyl ester carboxylesterase
MARLQLLDLGLSYEQAGSGSDVVLIHGLGANLAFWYFDIMQKLAKEFRVTAFDLRGHGRSDMPTSGYTIGHMAGDLEGLLDHLSIGRVHLVGHSFGGAVALQAALRLPDRVASLTIADTRIRAVQPTAYLRKWAQWPEWSQQNAALASDLDRNQEMDFRLISVMARRQVEAPVGANDSETYRPFQVWGGRRMARRWLKLMSETTAERDFDEPGDLTPNRLVKLSLPVHAIYGDYSFCLETCRWLQQNLPDILVTMVPEAGHFHPAVKPDFFVDQLRQRLFMQERLIPVRSR